MNFEEMFPFSAVINLEHRKDRLASCREEFKKIGVNPIRKPGILFTQHENPWVNGTIGCFLSHAQLLNSAYLLGQSIFIFEDDVQFLDNKYNVRQILDNCCEELSQIEWDMFYIGGNILKPFYKETEHLGRLSWCQSTVAYGINWKFLPELIHLVNEQEIRKPIDLVYSEDVIPLCKAYISIPLLVIQKSGRSDIEGKEVQYESYLENRYWSNLKENK